MKKIRLLESVRGAAAIYVLLTHFLPRYVFSEQSHARFFFRFGQEAVMIFFLLSGFVIYYSFSRKPNQNFKEYFQRRALRIYPVFLLSLLMAYLSSSQGAGHLLPFDTHQFLGNFFMLQDYSPVKAGVWFDPFSNNAPLWSLSYEWWFYMMFFAIINLPSRDHQKWLVAAFSLIGLVSYMIYPNQIAIYLRYFIIWWTGVELARTYIEVKTRSIQNYKTPLFILAFFTFIQLIPILLARFILHKHLDFGVSPILEFRHFLFALIIISVALVISRQQLQFLDKSLSLFASLAPISYALYVLHVPLAANAYYLDFIPWPFVQAILYLVITFTVAYLAEVPLQRIWNRIVLRPSPKSPVELKAN